MTTLWRISNFVDLSGEGGLGASGRWHTEGRLVVYLADCPAGALLERIVHMTDMVEDAFLPLMVISH
jgi:RES domain-containing protein